MIDLKVDSLGVYRVLDERFASHDLLLTSTYPFFKNLFGGENMDYPKGPPRARPRPRPRPKTKEESELLIFRDVHPSYKHLGPPRSRPKPRPRRK